MRGVFLVFLLVLLAKVLKRKRTRNKKKSSQLAGKEKSFAEGAKLIPIKVKSRCIKRLAEYKQ
jgi:hypothetical protein